MRRLPFARRAFMVATACSVVVLPVVLAPSAAWAESPNPSACRGLYHGNPPGSLVITTNPSSGTVLHPGDEVEVTATWDTADWPRPVLHKVLDCLLVDGEVDYEHSSQEKPTDNDGYYRYRFTVPNGARGRVCDRVRLSGRFVEDGDLVVQKSNTICFSVAAVAGNTGGPADRRARRAVRRDHHPGWGVTPAPTRRARLPPARRARRLRRPVADRRRPGPAARALRRLPPDAAPDGHRPAPPGPARRPAGPPRGDVALAARVRPLPASPALAPEAARAARLRESPGAPPASLAAVARALAGTARGAGHRGGRPPARPRPTPCCCAANRPPRRRSRRPPEAVRLRFSEPVEVAFGAVRVFDVDGKRVDAGEDQHRRRAAGRSSCRPACPEGPTRSPGGSSPPTATASAAASSSTSGRHRRSRRWRSRATPAPAGWSAGATAPSASPGTPPSWPSSASSVVRRFVWTPAVRAAGLADSDAAARFRRRFNRALPWAWAVLLVGLAPPAGVPGGVGLRARPGRIGPARRAGRHAADRASAGRGWPGSASRWLAGLAVAGLTRRDGLFGARPQTWLSVLAGLRRRAGAGGGQHGPRPHGEPIPALGVPVGGGPPAGGGDLGRRPGGPRRPWRLGLVGRSAGGPQRPGRARS